MHAVIDVDGAAVAVQVRHAVGKRHLFAEGEVFVGGQFDAEMQGFCRLCRRIQRRGEVGAAVVEGRRRDVVFEGKCPAAWGACAVAAAAFL